MASNDHSVLLSSGYRMPLVGLGMWQTDSEDSVQTALETAIDAGYRHIDTALAYQNEHFIGSALDRLFHSGEIRREDLFVVTKLPGNGMRPENVEYFFRKSLSDLRLDYVDLYLIHSPIAAQRTEDDTNFLPVKDGVFLTDDSVDLVETWKAMEALVDEGLVRSIGLSNFNSQQIQRIFDAARIKPANLQVECHAYLPQYELYDFCQKLNITLTAYSPLGSPGLPSYAAKRFGIEIKQDNLVDDPRLKPISEKHGKTSAQILLRYLVQRGIIAIPKSINPARIRENIQVFDFSLSEDDMAILKSMDKKHRYFGFNVFEEWRNHPEFPFNIPY